MDFAGFLTSFTTLFVMIDPIGLTPLFIAMTQGMDSGHRFRVALRACGVALVLLAAFGLFGLTLLTSIGITLPAFRIAGGFLLFLIAVEMLFERRTQRREGQERQAPDDPSVFPLATPLIAGPGALAAMVLLAASSPNWGGQVSALLAMVSVLAIVLAFFSIAGVIERALGRTGILVVTRLLGMLLAALSVQFVIDGLQDLRIVPL